MAHILVKRNFEIGLDHQAVQQTLDMSGGCLGDWGVDWKVSYSSMDGTTFLCHFEAADADSVRMALRQSGTEQNARVWATNNLLGNEELPINVAVERDFNQAIDVNALQKIEDDNAWCLELYNVKFVKTLITLDKKHMVCFYNAPDAESVRMAQSKANLPYTQIWACKELLPEQFNLSSQ